NGFKATSSSPALNKRSSTPSSAENQAFVSFLPDTAQSDICNSEIIRRYIQSREDQYCDYDRISIFCGTYNVNGQSCNGVSLDDWLAHKTQEAPDIYAIGFQELDLSQQAYIFDTGKEHEWACTVKKSLPSSENFKELKRIRLVGIFLLVYIKKRLFGFVDHNSVECNSVATGLLNMMGNKGAVAVRFKIHDSTLCFIASHLAAGSDELMRRNQDYKEICKLYFQPSMPLSYKSQSLKIEIFDHDLIFWLGDLNYRLYEPGPSTKNFYMGTNLDAKFVKHKCNLFEYDFLLRYDQLSIMRRENLAFHEFREGLITFAPTYKYDPGTDVWDTSEKCRAPAWTDRILWIGDGIEQLHYDSVPSLKLSDHKPVYSLFQAKIRRINDAKYSKIYESALREADRIENEYLPQVKIDKLEFHFKDVKFFEPQSDNCVIKNVGKLPVQYSFVSKSPSTKEYCKSWIMVTPDRFTIKVDEECVLNVTVTVDKMSVRKILTGEDNMQDHLVLHLHGGRHIFLSISANFIPTCFGRSLSELMTYKQTGVEPNVGKLIDLGDEPETTQCKRMSNAALLGIPVQIYRLATQIIQKGSQMIIPYLRDERTTYIYHDLGLIFAGFSTFL
uniref:Inositol polyphosphate-related phosphatase domain-containing protein n=1 Tax=Romanomermis culicivorax TaxID=13658 RepID=A0A915HM72_ROMCU